MFTINKDGVLYKFEKPQMCSYVRDRYCGDECIHFDPMRACEPAGNFGRVLHVNIRCSGTVLMIPIEKEGIPRTTRKPYQKLEKVRN